MENGKIIRQLEAENLELKEKIKEFRAFFDGIVIKEPSFGMYRIYQSIQAKIKEVFE